MDTLGNRLTREKLMKNVKGSENEKIMHVTVLEKLQKRENYKAESEPFYILRYDD